MQFTETMAAVEAILFVSGDPVNVEALAHSMNLTAGEMENVLTDMARSYVEDGRGVRLNRSGAEAYLCLLYTSPSPRDRCLSRMPSSA